MKEDGGGLLVFVIASPSFYLMKLSNVYHLRYSVSEFSLYMLRWRIYCQGNIGALEVSTACDILIPSFLMGTRTLPRHSFAAGNDFGVI